ncbi:MAG: PDDEXK nuclease domain-containing protein [Candidatus Aminicenantes bacterium]|nr:PDDEXK nuclease domain-containing protein [Candidatus Aminicenantes bacterium]
MKLIQTGRSHAYSAINVALIDTYWAVGSYLSSKVAHAGWGKGVVNELAQWLAWKAPDIKGFSAQNLWRMKQFFELYNGNEKLSALLRELSWTNNCIIMAQCKSLEEKMFYLQNAAWAHWSKRELEGQIKSGAFERTMLAEQKLSPVVRELPQDVGGIFKDSYMLDFIDLPSPYHEKDLREALVKNLCRFLLELGDGFTFVGEKVRLQVGNTDFELDLLFYHRDLQCLVAFELKTGKFEPAHIGQLSFYLEALDRDRKRPHENPSIGVLLCRNKDDEVVEYALSRTLSPALVAEYEHKLISRALLKQKMHEWATMLDARNAETEATDEI